MAWLQAYQCDHCGQIEEARSGDFRHYVVTWQDDPVSCGSRTGWCYDCRKVRPIESFPDITSLENLQMEIKHSGIPQWMLIGANPLEDEAEHHGFILKWLEATVRWRKERVSPPRCLFCGSIRNKVLELNANTPLETFEHEGCSGTFHWTGSMEHLNTNTCIQLTSEGLQM